MVLCGESHAGSYILWYLLGRETWMEANPSTNFCRWSSTLVRSASELYVHHQNTTMDTVINRRYLKVVGSFRTHVCGSKNGSTDASYRRCVSCLTLVSDSDTCRSIQLFSFLKLLLVLVCQGRFWCLCLCRCFISCNLYPCRGCLFQGNDLYQSFQLCKLEKWKPTVISDEDAVFWTLLS